MVRWVVMIVCFFGMAQSVHSSALDDSVDRYLTVWADNARVTPTAVTHFYARSVDYYGKTMSNGAVYRDKIAYVEQWPLRRYDVVPGSVGQTCDAGHMHCHVTAILRWSKANTARGRSSQGANTMTLDLVREAGGLKITKESGTPVVSASCSGITPDRTCAGFH